MARLIINDGSGPRSFELSGLMTVGSNPECDIVLEHPTALGVRIELKPLKYGYRARLVKGELQHNERECEMADLDHNDTMRVGEILLLYKQPEGDAFSPDAVAPSVTATAAAAAPTEELGELEELDDLDGLEDAGGLDELELDGLDELSLDDGGGIDLDELDSFEPVAADASADLDFLEDVDLGDAPTTGAHGGTVEEIDLGAAAAESVAEAVDAGQVPGELDGALQRARWKRLELLRRLDLGVRGEPTPEAWPELSEPGALETVAALDRAGEAGSLEAFEAEHDLTEMTLRELGAVTPASLRGEPEPVADLEPLDELEELDASEDALEALEEVEELEELDELEEADELDELEELEELEELAQAESFEELPALEELAEEQAAEEAAEAQAESFEQYPALDALDGDAELEELEDLEELDVAQAAAPAPAAPVAPAPSFGAPRPAAPRPRAPSVRPAAASVPAPTPGVAPAAPPPLPAAPTAAQLAPRPLPPEGVRFTRPLPPGHAAPTSLPPVHPGRPA